jgi:hypothetical protein
MKIESRIECPLKLKNGKDEYFVIKGIITAPDRPLKGDIVHWPYSYSEITPDDDEGCVLIVIDSYWVTVDRSKIVPRIILASKINDDPEGESYSCRTLTETEAFMNGARLLLSDPKICWGESSEWLTLPTSVTDYPMEIQENMPEE